MFEFPELFGSPHVLPGLIAVVVLLLLALLLTIRRRRRSSAGTAAALTRPPQAAGEAPPKTVPETEPTLPSKSPSPKVIPATSLGDRLPIGLAALPSTDPLLETLDSLLRGWGDLSDEELARLRIFRPDRVIAAINALELPPDLKKSHFAPARLNRLRAYASSLAAREAPGETATQALGETVTGSIPETSTETSTETSAETSEERPPEGTETTPTPTENQEQPTADLTTTEQPTEERVPSSDTLPPETVAVEEPLVEEVEDLVEVQELPVEEQLTEIGEPAAEESALPEEPVITLEEAPGPPENTPSQTFTAEHLFALPSADRQRMLVLLDPKELAKVYETTTDIELKKAVIDVLEQVGSPAHLELLHRCLDDPDPAIQLYALAAADRILGSDH